MPELPEVEVIRRGLAKKLVGQTFAAVRCTGQRLRRQSEEAILAGLVGRQVTGLIRRGKYLLIRLDDGQRLLVHLGMTGRLLFLPPTCVLPPHAHIILECREGHRLVFQDVRRFGQFLLYPAGAVIPEVQQIGLEPWSRRLTPAWLAAKAAGLTKPIKNFLLDGRIIAGIGNIYASEILFAAGLPPGKPVGQIRPEEWTRLLQACRRILSQAIQAGGTTIADFADCQGQVGLFAVHLKVYGRAGEPCLTCGRAIQRLVLAGRSTFWCPNCQSSQGDWPTRQRLAAKG